jgi:hypothetical protein
MARSKRRKSNESNTDPYERLHDRIARAILTNGIRAVTKRLGRLSPLATYQLADAFDVKYERPKPHGVRGGAAHEQSPH